MKLLFKTILAAIILALVILFCSCSKESPLKNECGKAIWTYEYYDLNKHFIRDSVTAKTESVVCGQQFQNYKIEEQQRLKDTILTSFCINGIPQYYWRENLKTKQ